MISYDAQEVKIPSFKKRVMNNWIKQVAASYNKQVGELSYLFCNDPTILEVNRQYLNHDYFTDIITFDYSEDRKINGDIYISLDTVTDNAKEYNVPFDEELHRVIIHGVLHLCGLPDHSPEERQCMIKAENMALAMRKETPSEI